MIGTQPEPRSFAAQPAANAGPNASSQPAAVHAARDARAVDAALHPDRASRPAEAHGISTALGAAITLMRRLVALAFGIVQAALLMRVLLLALDANGANPLARLVLDVSAVFEAPARGMFRVDQIATGSGSIVDVTALVAVVGWTLAQGLLLAALSLVSPSPRR